MDLRLFSFPHSCKSLKAKLSTVKQFRELYCRKRTFSIFGAKSDTQVFYGKSSTAANFQPIPLRRTDLTWNPELENLGSRALSEAMIYFLLGLSKKYHSSPVSGKTPEDRKIILNAAVRREKAKKFFTKIRKVWLQLRTFAAKCKSFPKPLDKKKLVRNSAKVCELGPSLRGDGKLASAMGCANENA